MYSEEIKNIIEHCNNNIDHDTYIQIVKTSPQLDHIKYNPFGNYIEMWDDEGNYFKFHLYSPAI